MSVLQRKELEDSPLADLHAIASELGIEGYRALRREKLVGAILQAQGGVEAPEDSAPDGDLPTPEPEREPVEQAPEPEEATPPAADAGPAAGRDEDEAAEEQFDGETSSGTLDILPNGSGFIRMSGATQSSDDVYVSPAQIRRCELRAGDEVSGPVRPPRRSERHPSLVRVATVNGGDAEPPEERPEFAELTAVHPTERLPGPGALDAVPYGKGSRVAITGGPGSGATRLLREIARSLVLTEIPVTVVLVDARPEEVTDWQREEGIAVAGGSFDRPLETQVQAAELAVERAKRAVERGGDAVVILDSLEPLPAGAARRIFGAGRRVEEGGSLTVIAAVGSALEPMRQASTRITLDDAAEEPAVLGPLSGTQRADLLG